MRPARIYGVALASLAVAAAAFAQSTPQAVPEAPAAETTALAPTAADAEGATSVPDAASATPIDDTPATWGDPAKGQTVAGACAACHGLDGNAMLSGAPRIAGMPERYIFDQLQLFKAGHRHEALAPVMVPFAAMLSNQDMRDVGAWYATQRTGSAVTDEATVTDAASPYAGMKVYQVGEKLYRSGDTARQIPACMACHGPGGLGNPGPSYPALAGQSPTYTTERLQIYRTGTTTIPDARRHNFDLMAQVSKQLTDEEIAGLASYLHGLYERPLVASAGHPAKAH